MNKKSSPSEQFIQTNRETIGMKLRTLREQKGFSQDKLAEVMNVHRSTISKVETGRFAITIDYLVKFAWYLDFDLNLNEKGNEKKK